MPDATCIAALLQPFVGDTPVSSELADQLQKYLELLLRWNARINLTAVRYPEQIVTRHFGESLFAARLLRDTGAFPSSGGTLADVGSGAGFPGLPIKLLVPEIRLTLIESQNKKATFLREVIRTLELKNVEVFCGRAESWNQQALAVTLRAVEKFEDAVSAAAHLVSSGGTLCLLIGTSQIAKAQGSLASKWEFRDPSPIPLSDGRVVLVGNNNQ